MQLSWLNLAHFVDCVLGCQLHVDRPYITMHLYFYFWLQHTTWLLKDLCESLCFDRNKVWEITRTRKKINRFKENLGFDRLHRSSFLKGPDISVDECCKDLGRLRRWPGVRLNEVGVQAMTYMYIVYKLDQWQLQKAVILATFFWRCFVGKGGAMVASQAWMFTKRREVFFLGRLWLPAYSVHVARTWHTMYTLN